MFNLQGSEIIVILLIALVVLGPERLPDAVRRFMQTYNELKKMGSGFQAEIKSAFDEPMREMRNTANMVRDAADPSKLVAEAEAEQRLRDDAEAVAQGGVIDPGDVVGDTWLAAAAATATATRGVRRRTRRHADSAAPTAPAAHRIDRRRRRAAGRPHGLQ